MKLPWPRILLVANVVLVVLVTLFFIDMYVRWRVGQGISGYHAGVIAPLIQPRPTSGPPQPGKP